MHSYRSEVYASLASQLFLKIYAEYCNVIIESKVTGYCDNKAYVERLNQFIADPYMTRGLFKQTEEGAYRSVVPNNSCSGHQDNITTIEELDTPAKLNIEVDIVATTKARTPINTHLLSASFAIYINARYIPYQFEC